MSISGGGGASTRVRRPPNSDGRERSSPPGYAPVDTTLLTPQQVTQKLLIAQDRIETQDDRIRELERERDMLRGLLREAEDATVRALGMSAGEQRDHEEWMRKPPEENTPH